LFECGEAAEVAAVEELHPLAPCIIGADGKACSFEQLRPAARLGRYCLEWKGGARLLPLAIACAEAEQHSENRPVQH
jgi:hypothetical protein